MPMPIHQSPEERRRNQSIVDRDIAENIYAMDDNVHPKSQENNTRSNRNRKIAKFLAGIVMIGGLANVADRGIQESRHESRLKTYNLANDPKKLDKFYQDEHSSAVNYTFKVIKAGEANPTEVAIVMHAKDIPTVAEEIDGQTSIVVDGVSQNSMHPGQKIIIPNSQLQLDEQSK